MKRQLTDRQRQVLWVIRDYIDTHGYPPSIREIATAMGIGSTNGVNDHLRALERKGAISVTPMISRGIRLLSGGRS